jgi:hypothetical protein
VFPKFNLVAIAQRCEWKNDVGRFMQAVRRARRLREFTATGSVICMPFAVAKS